MWWPFGNRGTALKLPDNAWIREVCTASAHTPDIAILQQQKRHLLFVYDGMQRNHAGNEQMAQHGIFQATAFTTGRYSVFKQNMGKLTHPIPVEDKFHGTPHTRIRGELFSVESSFFMELDKIKKNMVEFQRTKVEIEIPYREVVFLHNRKEVLGPSGEPVFHTTHTSSPKLAKGSVWMYVGISDYWNKLFDWGYAFSLVKTYVPNDRSKEPYYLFNTSEY